MKSQDTIETGKTLENAMEIIKTATRKYHEKDNSKHYPCYVILAAWKEYNDERSEDAKGWTPWVVIHTTAVATEQYKLDDEGEFEDRPKDPEGRAMWHVRNCENRYGHYAKLIKVEGPNKKTVLYMTPGSESI